MKYITSFLLTVFFLLSIPLFVEAKELSCDQRFLTIVHPVRARRFWQEQSLRPIKDQYDLIKEKGFKATWLIQYEILEDYDLLKIIHDFESNQEIGLFLEVTEDFAKDSRVIYPHAVDWANPKAVFLSAYSRSERKKLIDNVFRKFEKKFGYYPESVGAWWIDSFSLDYMKEKYGIKAVIIVADQKTTDRYGVWGQWWGIPYYPSKVNILTPASDTDNIQRIPVMQWAQRDISKAYGDGPEYSNFSLQANDYLERGLNTDYFKQLTDSYLNCNIPLGQITVGLETGMEGVTYFREYSNQLTYLEKVKNLNSVTMSEFADEFLSTYSQNPTEVVLENKESFWVLSPSKRENRLLGDEVIYSSNVSFSDYFLADKSEFLNRVLSNEYVGYNTSRSYPYFIAIFLIVLPLVYKKRLFTSWIASILFSVSSFGLVLKSNTSYGWRVYYGPIFENIIFLQILVTVLVVGTFLLAEVHFRKRKLKQYRLLFWLFPLSFFLDGLLIKLRYSFIEGKHLFGIALDALRFVGVRFSSNHLSIVNMDMPSVQAQSLLKFNFEKMWNNSFMSFCFYPAIHVALAFFIWTFLKKMPQRFRRIMLVVFVVIFVYYINILIGQDPRFVTPYA